jgi:stearoyl-CoA desaturase (delta-9 desaturase)
MGSTRQGFYWYEIDVTYYILRGLQAVGLIWDIKEPPARVYDVSTHLPNTRKLKPVEATPVPSVVPAADPTLG